MQDHIILNSNLTVKACIEGILTQDSAIAIDSINSKQWIKLLCAFIVGGLWGIPWIESAQNAAEIFPKSIQPIMAFVLAVGIVVTVGADGFWLMI